MLTRHIDNWDINVYDDGDSPFPIRVVAVYAIDGRSEAASGRDTESALLDLARKIHVDRRELLALYGID